MTSEDIRYDRQLRIKHWSQEKLTNSRIALIGDGQLAHFTSASLAALGIGNIEIYAKGNPGKEGFLTHIGRRENTTLEKKLKEMNHDINIKRDSEPVFKNPDLILELTNSPESKRDVLEYAAQNKIKTISASTGRTGGELCLIEPGEEAQNARLEKYSWETQGGFSSEILGGMITEEVRKILMPLEEGEIAARNLAYNATAERRFANEGNFKAQPFEDMPEKRVLIVGAGALGNFVALGAALEGIGKIDILDFDEVEGHNLNRQILFYDAVGKKKSTALAEKIKGINPAAEVRGLIGKLDEKTDYFDKNKPDLILDCVDSFAARAIINYFAVGNKIPLVSGGTNYHSGQVIVYEPGQSSCLNCKLGVETALGMALQGNKCTNAPDPSVIMTNEVIGGIMVGEALKVLDKGYGAPVSRIIKYDSTVPSRGGLIGASEPCGCSYAEIKEWLQGVKDRFSYQERRK